MTFIGNAGPYRILVGFMRVTPLRLLKVHSDIAVTSAPVSILKWMSLPSSFRATVQGEVFPEFRTPIGMQYPGSAPLHWLQQSWRNTGS